MHITQIKSSGIEGFGNQEQIIFLNKGINILIGPNGSGKSTLLDTVSTALGQYIMPNYDITYDEQIKDYTISLQRHQHYYNIFSNNPEVKITFVLSISDWDIKNISLIRKHYLQFHKYYEHLTLKLSNIINHNIFLKAEEEVIIRVENNRALYDTNHSCLEEYLKCINIFYPLNIFLNKKLPFCPPFLYVPPKTFEGFIEPVTLTEFGKSVRNKIVAKEFGSKIDMRLELPILHMCQNFWHLQRKVEKDGVNNKAEQKFFEQKHIQVFVKAFKKLGMQLDILSRTWSGNTSSYQLKFKQISTDRDIPLHSMSSGERQITSLILGIIGLNPHNTIIIIEESELHLHAQWQNVLLEVFQELAEYYKCQIILTTHSPAFIKPNTINNVLRCYKEGRESKVVSLRELDASAKDKINIINSSNNEKLFFAEKVVLVEGLTDKIFFEKAISLFKKEANALSIIEIVSVEGKHELEKYRAICDKAKIKNYTIADLDYLKEVKPEAKQYFTISKKDMIKKATGQGKHKDSNYYQTFYEAIETEDWKKVKELWRHLRSKCEKPNLEKYKSEIEKLINDSKIQNIFILKNRDIEKYLPIGCGKNNKDRIETLIKFCNDNEKFKKWLRESSPSLGEALSQEQRQEIEGIINQILN